MAVLTNLLKDALYLEEPKRAELIEELLARFDQPDKAIDGLWAKDADRRIDADGRRRIGAVVWYDGMA